MEKILIIGCSGSGKSTLAVALGEKLGLPVVHLDQLWWKEGWRNVTREEFDSRLAMAMNMDGWIIDGNYSRTMEMRLAKCDTVIYLDFNRWACLRGMCQRVFGNYGKVRPDMPQGCPRAVRSVLREVDLGLQQKQPGAQLHVPRPGEARQGDRSEKPEGG